MRIYLRGDRDYFITIGRVHRGGALVAQGFDLGVNAKKALAKAGKLSPLAFAQDARRRVE